MDDLLDTRYHLNTSTPFHITQIWILSSAILSTLQAYKGSRILQRKTYLRFEVTHSLLRQKNAKVVHRLYLCYDAKREFTSLRVFESFTVHLRWSSCHRAYTPTTLGSNIRVLTETLKGTKCSRTSLVFSASVCTANNFHLVRFIMLAVKPSKTVFPWTSPDLKNNLGPLCFCDKGRLVWYWGMLGDSCLIKEGNRYKCSLSKRSKLT